MYKDALKRLMQMLERNLFLHRDRLIWARLLPMVQVFKELMELEMNLQLKMIVRVVVDDISLTRKSM